jgi:hypothetical protein
MPEFDIKYFKSTLQAAKNTLGYVFGMQTTAFPPKTCFSNERFLIWINSTINTHPRRSGTRRLEARALTNAHGHVFFFMVKSLSHAIGAIEWKSFPLIRHSKVIQERYIGAERERDAGTRKTPQCSFLMHIWISFADAWFLNPPSIVCALSDKVLDANFWANFTAISALSDLQKIATALAKLQFSTRRRFCLFLPLYKIANFLVATPRKNCK